MFKRKPKEDKQATLQQLQEKFNKTFQDLTVLHHRKYVMSQEISSLNADINTLHQEADKIGVEAKKVQALLQEEVQKTIKQGEQSVTSDSKVD